MGQGCKIEKKRILAVPDKEMAGAAQILSGAGKIFYWGNWSTFREKQCVLSSESWKSFNNDIQRPIFGAKLPHKDPKKWWFHSAALFNAEAPAVEPEHAAAETASAARQKRSAPSRMTRGKLGLLSLWLFRHRRLQLFPPMLFHT